MQGGDPTGTGRGGESYWGEPFRDEYSEKGAYKHDSRGVLASRPFGIKATLLTLYIVNGKLWTADEWFTILFHVPRDAAFGR